jgi:Tetracyclin repressor-like, C-terminal domain
MRRLDSSCMLAPSATRSFRQMGLAQPFRDVIGIGLCGELVQLEPISNGEHRIALQDNCHGFARFLVKAELAGSCGQPNIGWTKIRQASRGGSYFSRLVVSVAASGDPRSCTLIADNYDPVARRFIDAFRRVLPDLSEPDAVRGYLFVIGVGMTIMAPTGRLNRLSRDCCDDADIDSMVAYAVPFAAAGLRAYAAGWAR